MTTPMQSWSFVIFAAAAVLLYYGLSWLVDKLKWPRKLLSLALLVMSLGYFFAASLPEWAERPGMALMRAAVLLVALCLYLWWIYIVGIMIDISESKRAKTIWLVLGVGTALLLLFTFKTIDPIRKLTFALLGMETAAFVSGSFLWIGVPLGISYFSFRAIHYIAEIYRGNGARATALEFFHYVTFFPTMVSGPIHRFYKIGREKPEDAFGRQMQLNGGAPRIGVEDINYGMWRLLQGLVKKFVLADFLFRLAGPMMKMPLMLGSSTGQLWLASHAYFAYLYVEFSGYSDIAIGLSRLMGYRVMENFSWPILAPNLQEFWRRWHTSLTGWLMNYIYFPLGGGRKGNFRTDVNIMITIIAVALWHKVNMSMFLWGFFEGLALITFRHWNRFKQRAFPNRKPTWWGRVIGIVMVWHVHGLLWPLFHHNFKIALLYYVKMIPILPLLTKGAGPAAGLGG
ncbi:MAG: MBOAT family O-acyltransferase [Candidatus Lernaella stagnicola]|nr:MBOAT family O-acyltransferase [Candidatus Lernaella stagnicola]